MTECESERIAIIAEGCRISQTQAERIYAEQVKINPFADVADRLKSALRNAKARKYKRWEDRKLMSSGA